MRQEPSVWAIVLAAGQAPRGSDPGPAAVGGVGDGSPIAGDRLLRAAVERAAGLVPARRIVVVVAPQRSCGRPQSLPGLHPNNVLVQPRDRGTAVEILLPLFHVLFNDPNATVVLLPAEHRVETEPVLAGAVAEAIHAAESLGQVALLGSVPEPGDDHAGLGWIVPAKEVGSGQGRAVGYLVEKADSSGAASLARGGALVNTSILAAPGCTLLDLFLQSVPDIVDRFLSWADEELGQLDSTAALASLYEGLRASDFGGDVLERATGRLLVVPLPRRAWLGEAPPSLRASRAMRPGHRRRETPAKPLRESRARAGRDRVSRAQRRRPGWPGRKD
jgi:mannose-1-phosphate guanylyltransferase